MIDDVSGIISVDGGYGGWRYHFGGGRWHCFGGGRWHVSAEDGGISVYDGGTSIVDGMTHTNNHRIQYRTYLFTMYNQKKIQ